MPLLLSWSDGEERLLGKHSQIGDWNLSELPWAQELKDSFNTVNIRLIMKEVVAWPV